MHEHLNQHFDAINGRAKSTHHYWADASRDMLSLIDELKEVLDCLRVAGVEVSFADDYRVAVDQCEAWLSISNGSTVPDGFRQIRLHKFEPVFTRTDISIRLKKQNSRVQLKMIGEGSYANVYSYIDPDYGIKFAVKRAKKGMDERDLHRFKQEFEILKRLSFPYVVEVYEYDISRNEYSMEFCDVTLREYIAKRNNSLSFASRKSIAIQFLYGINYLHSQRLLHRDISLQNVLLKVYGSGAALVKLSDFGLVKDRNSEFTRTKTEMRGTIRDPMLSDFKSYNHLNEIYAAGVLISYIFTGKESPKIGADAVSVIAQKCVAHDVTQRYQSVLDLIRDVEKLE